MGCVEAGGGGSGRWGSCGRPPVLELGTPASVGIAIPYSHEGRRGADEGGNLLWLVEVLPYFNGAFERGPSATAFTYPQGAQFIKMGYFKIGRAPV